MDFNKKLQFWSHLRQHLNQRSSDVMQVLKNIIAVYSSHPTAPLSLHARAKSFTEQQFYLLETQRLVVRVPAMRETVYLLPRENATMLMSATLPPTSDPYWQKRYSQKGRFIPAEHYESWKDEIVRVAEKPLTAAAIKDVVDIPEATLKPVLNRMAFEGVLLRIGSDSLRSNTIRYVSREIWLREVCAVPDAGESLTWLAGEYLHAFGPARVKDFQW
jgi:hypothetical protein